MDDKDFKDFKACVETSLSKAYQIGRKPTREYTGMLEPREIGDAVVVYARETE